MYEAYYGLREKPFSILPDPDLIYWGQTHRMAFSMLEFGVMNNAQFTVITGEIGSGKTTLVRHLLKKLDPRVTNVGLISNTPQGTGGTAAMDHDVVEFAVRGIDCRIAKELSGFPIRPTREGATDDTDRRRSAKFGRGGPRRP